MTSITATQARKRLYALVDEVQESHEPIEITVTMKAHPDELADPVHSAPALPDAGEPAKKNLVRNPGFEEASRALFAKRDVNLRALIQKWPEDVRLYVERRLDQAAELESEGPRT